MDDPLVKADKNRLRKQIDILRRISRLGWQIIYFTAKDEIKEALRNDIRNGAVNFIETKGILAQIIRS